MSVHFKQVTIAAAMAITVAVSIAGCSKQNPPAAPPAPKAPATPHTSFPWPVVDFFGDPIEVTPKDHPRVIVLSTSCPHSRKFIQLYAIESRHPPISLEAPGPKPLFLFITPEWNGISHRIDDIFAAMDYDAYAGVLFVMPRFFFEEVLTTTADVAMIRRVDSDKAKLRMTEQQKAQYVPTAAPSEWDWNTGTWVSPHWPEPDLDNPQQSMLNIAL